jgi:Zn-dependent peptidase ImmA (M78 family)
MRSLQENINRINQLMKLVEGEQRFDNSIEKTINEFIDFVKKELKIENDVDVKLQNDKDGIKTTAVYKYAEGGSPSENTEVKVYTKDRALSDILRSIAHEMVHHKQNEDGKLDKKPSNVGGQIEDEANAKAGELLKKFGEKHPEIYNNENKEEMGEQEEGGGTTSSPTMSTWETGLQRGKANPLTISGDKWETGISRGKANPLW